MAFGRMKTPLEAEPSIKEAEKASDRIRRIARCCVEHSETVSCWTGYQKDHLEEDRRNPYPNTTCLGLPDLPRKGQGWLFQG